MTLATLSKAERSIVLRQFFASMGHAELLAAYQASLSAVEARKREFETGYGKLLATADADTTDEIEQQAADLNYETRKMAEHIRMAFLIALFHFFERQCIKLVNSRDYSRKNDLPKLARLGLVPDEEKLRHLELAANCAKHGPGTACNALFKEKPEWFQQPNRPGLPFKPSDINLDITADILDSFFDAVRQALQKPRRPTSPKRSTSL